ncbi:c-type cytochrome [Glacieibacterium megasporae]|uniref:c-type cytochrome n=1 Tax=Glacieibacterium megasporae TaxID=2835787 RepID=UPI001C1E4E8F|nr:c-type cytochrome [Polymorphobacter megasporae]UAJ12774.1 c-type cytochrome [Polymorphobacter megasporae]
MAGLVIARVVILLVGLAAASPSLADAAAGQKVFQSQCSTCHAVTSGTMKIGPSLYAIVGRAAGTETGYRYSPAMTKSGLTWTSAELHTYLAAPRKAVPGTKMTYAGVKDPAKLDDVVAYLETVK